MLFLFPQTHTLNSTNFESPTNFVSFSATYFKVNMMNKFLTLSMASNSLEGLLLRVQWPMVTVSIYHKQKTSSRFEPAPPRLWSGNSTTMLHHGWIIHPAYLSVVSFVLLRRKCEWTLLFVFLALILKLCLY